MARLRNMWPKKFRIYNELGRDHRTGKRRRKYKTFSGTKKESELEKLEMIKKYKDYKSSIENHLIPALGRLKLKKLNPRHIIQYHTIKHAISPYEYINKNPCQGVTHPSPKPSELLILIRILLRF